MRAVTQAGGTPALRPGAQAPHPPTKAPPWDAIPGLRRLPRREGAPPRIGAVWPCPQLEETAPPALLAALADAALRLHGVTEAPPPARMQGRGFALDEALARGQPEAFLAAPVFLVLRDDGSMHLNLRPEWAARIVARGWGVVHPLARYMAGAVPPQSLVIYAPRDTREVALAARIAAAAHAYAMGRIGDLILPDTHW